jgi:hypothetical protein
LARPYIQRPSPENITPSNKVIVFYHEKTDGEEIRMNNLYTGEQVEIINSVVLSSGEIKCMLK